MNGERMRKEDEEMTVRKMEEVEVGVNGRMEGELRWKMERRGRGGWIE